MSASPPSNVHLLKFSNRKLARVPMAEILREYNQAQASLQSAVPIVISGGSAAAAELGARFLLSLHSNQLQDVPEDVGQLTRVVELLLHSNQLRSLPHGVGALRLLTSVALNNNAFESLPDALFACRQLRSVYLSHNRLRSLPSKLFSAWPDLQVLTLARNQIAVLPAEFGLLSSLCELNVSGNLLIRLCPELAACTALRSLDVSHNDLAALPAALGALDKLRSLTLDACPLLVPPPAVVSRGAAAVRRHLADLHAAAQRCLRLKLMLVGGENVGKTSLARALARAAVAHVSAEPPSDDSPAGDEPSSSSSASTLSVSSSGGSGASSSSPSIGRFLKLGHQPKRLLSTDGIAIETIALDYVPANGARVERGALQCLVWDFAGQDVYGATHQFFVSPHSIFLVCFDLRKPESSSSVQHWLETISALVGPNAPVIVVGTHLDAPQCTDQRVDAILDQLYDKYQEAHPGICSYMPVSSTGLGVLELRQQIETVAARAPFIGKPVPAPVVALDAALVHLRGARSPPAMSWSEWLRLCSQCGVGSDMVTVGGGGDLNPRGSYTTASDRASYGSMATLSSFGSASLSARGFARRSVASAAVDDVRQATDFLHSLGSLLFFDDADAGLNDVVVFNPGWLADALATIVTTKQQFASGGILKATSLPHIWKAPKFPPALHSELLALLERYDLVLPIRGAAAASYVVPLLLPPLARDVREQLTARVAPSVGRYWAFASYVPPGFFGRMLARVARVATVDSLHRDAFVASFRAESVEGEQRATLALVSFAAGERMLRIETGGARAGALLSVLIEVVDSLVRTWFQVASTAFVPCPHCLRTPALQATPFLFRHELVLRAATSKKTTLMCRGQTPVPLVAIAPDVTLSEVDSKRIDLREVRILREIARGGFGIVYEAQWRGEITAVKLMNTAGDRGADGATAAFAEFRREVSFMVGLRHPNIVGLLAFALDPCALVMELVTGGDLYTYLHKSPLDAPLDEPLRLKMAWDIAAGMAYLHGNELVHRDLKSPNILLASNDAQAVCVAKVSDFGLSVRQFDGAVRDGAERSVENPTWLAPETLQRNEFNQASDVYAFGVILFELQTREHPWEAERFQFGHQLEEAVIKGRRPLLPLGGEPRIAELTTRAWAPNPRERPSFAELCDALARLATQRTPQVHASRVLSTEEPAAVDELLPERVLFLNRAAVAPSARVLSLAVVPAAGHVWCGTEQGFITVFEAVAPGCALFSWRAHEGAVTSLLHAFGSVWSASADGTVRVWQCVGDAEADGAEVGGVIDERAMPKGAALVQQVMTARASAALAVSDQSAHLETTPSGRPKSFVVERIELSGSLSVMERKGFRTTWKQRRCELRDDGAGSSTFLVFSESKGDSAKDVLALSETSVVLTGAAAAAIAGELKGRVHAFVLHVGDQVRLFDAGSAVECARWVAALDAVMARAKRTAELTLLLHVIALPPGSAALSLTLPGGGGEWQASTIWCTAERPGALHWIDAVRGVVVCTLTFGDVFRGARQTPALGAALFSGPALAVLSNVWLATDNVIAVCDARSGRCSGRLIGHTGAVQALALVADEVWSGARDATIRVWRAVDGMPLATLECQRSVHALLSCGRVVWSGGADSSLTLWSVADRTAVLRVQAHISDVISTVVAVGERCVWAGSWDGTVSLFTGPVHEWSWRPVASAVRLEQPTARATSPVPRVASPTGNSSTAGSSSSSNSSSTGSSKIVDIVATRHRASARLAETAMAKRERIHGASHLRQQRRISEDHVRAMPQLPAIDDDVRASLPLPPLPPTPKAMRGSHEFAELLADDDEEEQ